MPVETELRAVAGPPGQAALSAGADAVAVPVRPTPAGPLVEAAPGIHDLLPVSADALLDHHNAKGEPGEILALPVALGDGLADLLLYGVGDLAPAGLRRAGAALSRRCRGRKSLVIVPPWEVPAEGMAALAEGALLAGYTFRMTGATGRTHGMSSGETGGEPAGSGAAGKIDKIGKTGTGGAAATAATADRQRRPPRDIVLVDGDERLVRRVRTVVAAVALARDLANTPSTDKSPDWLADRAGELAERGGLTIRVLTEEELAAEGFGGLLAVGAGSPRPPRLIELSYDPPAARAAGGPAPGGHTVLIGKGITFDSGGLSLKPTANMKLMKTDMAGGAVVIAVLGALADLGVSHRVTGLVAAAENMPSGSAMRPGDVIRHFGGRTSEVLNTDAEGRLVLADALAYADARLEPTTVVDVATLTGAAKVALGLRYGAMYATDDALAAELFTAGEDTGERVWRMPLVDDYRAFLDSEIADVANIERGGGAGSIAAALFLREFAGDRRWAHLDIAGPARAASDEGDITKGATGYGVRLLLRWLAGAGELAAAV